MKLHFQNFQAQVNFRAEDNGFSVRGDRLHLTSVLYNLIDNALKYGGDNPQIDLHLEKDDSLIKLTVSDSGPGIPREYRKKVFEKFFRVPRGDRHDVKGYGLGLSYVTDVVRRHGGRIELINENQFIIYLRNEVG